MTHSDSGDYTYVYPSSIRFVPESKPYGDAASLLDNATEPTALQSAAAAHRAAQDRRLDALERENAHLWGVIRDIERKVETYIENHEFVHYGIGIDENDYPALDGNEAQL